MHTSFEVSYPSCDAVLSARDRELRHRGVFVSTPTLPAAFSRVEIIFRLPNKLSVEVHGTVVNVAAHRSGFFVQFEEGVEYEALMSAIEFLSEIGDLSEAAESVVAGEDSETLLSAAEGLESEEEPSSTVIAPNSEALSAEWNAELTSDAQREEVPVAVDVVVSAPAAEGPVTDSEETNTSKEKKPPLAGVVRSVWELIDYGSDVPLDKQLEVLNPAEKLKLARHATRPLRRLLIRETDKTIHLEVVKNPKLTFEEALEYSCQSAIAPIALEWLANQKRYVRDRRLVMNLIANRQTPVGLALRFVSGLKKSELVKVLRSKRPLEAVSQAAKKRLLSMN